MQTLRISGHATGPTCEELSYDAVEEPAWPDWAVWIHRVPLTAVQPQVDPAAAERLARENELAFQAGYAQGTAEGQRLERASHGSEDEERQEAIGQALEEFVNTRDRYLQALEPEVVRLALGIAARILRRESQTDPLLLTGAVRVALGQLAASTEVRILVPSAEHSMWAEWASLLPNVKVKVRVEAEASLRIGECRLEAEIGSVDLSVRTQLREIEQSFFAGHARPDSHMAEASS